MIRIDPRETRIDKIAEALSRLTRHRQGTVTLTANAASTTVVHSSINADVVISLMPTTANAAAALGTTYIVPAKGQFVINHANNAQVDKTFAWAVAGTH